MERIIKPIEVQMQVGGMVAALERDREQLQEVLPIISDFSQEKELQGKAWTGMKEQLLAHRTVIRGCICMAEELMQEGRKLVMLCGLEELNEDELKLQIQEIEQIREKYKEAVRTYQNRLRDNTYEKTMGWYARSQIKTYEQLIELTNEKIRILHRKLTNIDRIDRATRNLTDSLRQLMQNVKLGIQYLENSWDGSGFLPAGRRNMAWMSELNGVWESTSQQRKKQFMSVFYNALPKELKECIKREDLIATDDGMVLCKKSLADVLIARGITDVGFSEANKDVEKYYDDWYFYGICDKTGKITFSLLKMREKEYDSYDGNKPGVSVSFIPLDMKQFAENANKKEGIKKFIDGIILSNQDINSYGTILQGYFSNAESSGSYLIADEYVKKIAQTQKEGRIELPDCLGNKKNGRIIEALQEINENAGTVIYDSKENVIRIKNENDLSDYEKTAILSACTGDTSYSMFAAEIKFHSDGLEAWQAKIPIVGSSVWYARTVVANMEVGEEKESGVFDQYYNPNSKIVKEEEKYHGKK